MIVPVKPTLATTFIAFLPPSPLSLAPHSSGLNVRVCPLRGSTSSYNSCCFFASATPEQPTSDPDEQLTSDTPYSEPTGKQTFKNPTRKVSPPSKSPQTSQADASKKLQPNLSAATVDPDAFADDFEAEDDLESDTGVDLNDFLSSESGEQHKTNESTETVNNIPKFNHDSDQKRLAENPFKPKSEDDLSRPVLENTNSKDSTPQISNQGGTKTQPSNSNENEAFTVSNSEKPVPNENVITNRTRVSPGPKQKESNPVVKTVSNNPVKLDFSTEKLEKARSARRAAASEAEKKSATEADRNEKLKANIEKVATVFGKRTRAVELGRKARARAEEAINGAISKGEQKTASSTARLTASAASAAKALVTSAEKTWNERFVPPIRKQLSPEFSDISSSALSSTIIGVLVAVLLLPSLISSPPKPQSKTPEVAKLDRDTANLEKKLNRGSRSTPQTVQPTTPEKSPFPPEKALNSMLSAEKAPKEPLLPQQPVPPSVPVPKAEKPTSSPQKLNKQASETSKPVPSTKPSQQVQTEPTRLREVTPDSTMSTIARALGANANIVLSASFDSLYEEPTVALTVSKKFHTLPSEEQRRITEAALIACRSLGYERVTLTEEESGKQVAQAGIDVDLEDETENLRAQVAAMRDTADRLALRAADDEVTIGSLKARLGESRELIARQQAEYSRSIATLRKDNTDLADDLIEAKDELARMPDRMELEQRTIAAEEKSEKMASSVEILSLELAKARQDQAAAERKASDAIARADAALSEKQEAIAAADARSAQASKTADARAENAIFAAQSEARNAIDGANERVRAAEEKLETAQREAQKNMRDGTAAFNKQLDDERAARVRDVQAKQKEADKRASDAIALAEKEARASVGAADSRAKVAEDKLAASEKDAASVLQEKSSAFEKQLSDERANREKEVTSVTKKYEAMLEEAERKSKAELDALQKSMDQKFAAASKDAKAVQAGLTKERDDAKKETERSEVRAQKAAEKAMKERDSLLRRLERLQNKAKDENNVTSSY